MRKFCALLLCVIGAACSIEPVSTTGPVPCEPTRIQALAYVGGEPVWAWSVAQYPQLTATVLDVTGQPLDVSCPAPSSYSWERPLGTAVCQRLGDVLSRTIALKCTAPGDVRITVYATVGDDVLVGQLEGRVVG